MKNSTDCPELDTEYREEGSDLIEYIDGLTAEIGELKVRLQQINVVSAISRHCLVQTLDNHWTAEESLTNVFKVIERLADNQ